MTKLIQYILWIRPRTSLRFFPALSIIMGVWVLANQFPLRNAIYASTGKTTPAIVGRKAAAKYLLKSDSTSESKREQWSTEGPADHFLQIGVGRFMNSVTYEWGQHARQDDLGEQNAVITYRVGEWTNSMDFNIRIDYQEFKVFDQKLNKLSFLPLIVFPDAASRFPLYFGAGLGGGIFFRQTPGESALSLDYQLIVGARFMNISQNTGFYVESGLKNHLFVLTDGQFNGTFLNFGLVYTF